MTLNLAWHKYKYYPYEHDLALREVQTLLRPAAIRTEHHTVVVEQPVVPEAAHRLVYFSSAATAGGEPQRTQQCLLERVNGNGPNRQSTRYSAHGLHEYKGKFNPQIAKAMLNIFGAMPGQEALDPFCGSGTSLVECAHLGVRATGTDINPLAVMLANAKLKALSTPAADIVRAAERATVAAKQSVYLPQRGDARNDYLYSWFEEDILKVMERLRIALGDAPEGGRQVLIAIASNLLREYSLQDPLDLRIRRRKSPLPTTPFMDAFESAVKAFCARLSDAQDTLGVADNHSHALLADCRQMGPEAGLRAGQFDLALTSPPYATALPYIDTQRLSLVWLGLISPAEILTLESNLVGSREIRGQSKKELLAFLESNSANLPEEEAGLCIRLQHALADSDGFRRQVVPRLLYRYFSGMAEVFAAVRPLMKQNASFGLIVGGNHTVLGGTRFDIETPRHLANIAASRGWAHPETVELQTYKRYGLHAVNATTTEAFIVLRA